MSNLRLSSLSTRTLTQVLERQRLQKLSQTPPSSQLSQIKKNLEALRSGILELESGGEQGIESAKGLRAQYERMKRMLGPDGMDLETLPAVVIPEREQEIELPTVSPLSGTIPVHTPYADDDDDDVEPSDSLGVQRQMMDEQDTHLDTLSESIQRQRDISLQIGSELDVHTGLLEDMENGVDRTTLRLGGARRRLDRVAQGAKENGSAMTIGLLIFVLLILIIVFKT